MPGHDVIVMGASAGGVETLVELVSGLPASLPASVCVTMHVSPHVPSVLPDILNRCRRVPARHACNGEALEHGQIYVAPPDFHLLLHADGTLKLSRGPRENGHRPSIDPLFRSAARVYGSRVAGVVLSGNLDDGTAGLLAIHKQGGICIAQDPDEATFPSMPLSAIEKVHVDHILRAREIPGLLMHLARDEMAREHPRPPEQLIIETEIAAMNPQAEDSPEERGIPSGYICPDCNGTLFEMREGDLVRFRCRVGHAYSFDGLLDKKSGEVERALWSAMVALKEKAELSRRLVKFSRARGHALTAERFEQQSSEAEAYAKMLHKLIGESNSGLTETGENMMKRGASELRSADTC